MRFALIEGKPYAADRQGEVPDLKIERRHPSDKHGTPIVCLMVGVPPVPGTRHGNPAVADLADAPYLPDYALTRRYAECMVEALNREFGTPEPAALPPAGPHLMIAGQPVPIPEALDEVAIELMSGWTKPPVQRSADEHRAIARFIEYCDANGIALPRRTTPLENASAGGLDLDSAAARIAERRAATDPAPVPDTLPPAGEDLRTIAERALDPDPTEPGPGEAETDRILKQGRE